MPDQPLYRRTKFWLLLAVVAWVLLGFFALRGVPHIQDEYLHDALIRRLMASDWSGDSAVTVFPTQHLLIAWIVGAFTRWPGIDTLRMVAMLLHLLLLPAAYLVSRGAGSPRDDALRRVLMITMMPSITPFVFLIYVDVFALALVALSTAAAQRSRYALSALVSAAAVAVRQTNIVWCLWLAASWALARWRDTSRTSLGGLWYVAVFLAFGAVVLWNGGVVVGDATSHPVGSLFLGNVFFALVLHWIYFLPLHVAALPGIGRQLRDSPWRALWIVAGIAAFYLLFAADHPYNAIAPQYIMHNALVGWLQQLPGRLLGGIVFVWALATLWRTPLRGMGSTLLFPFAAASLLPLWLVEPRYAAPAIVLWLLLRRTSAPRTEWLLLAWLALIGGIVLAYQASYTMNL